MRICMLRAQIYKWTMNDQAIYNFTQTHSLQQTAQEMNPLHDN